MTKIIFDSLFRGYDQLLTFIPSQYHAVFSLGLVIFMAASFFALVRRNFLWVGLLILYVPAALPILKTLFLESLDFLKALLR